MTKGDASSSVKVVAENRKARFRYHLEEFFEAGLVLTGGEIKSIRAGAISLGESYVIPHRRELYLVNAHITPYAFDTNTQGDPTRRRKLLLHRREIDKLIGRVEAKGFTLVPVKVYLKKGRAKLQIALAKGKDTGDKRETIKERDAKREAQRAMKNQHR
ncbi:SsrA-binding protein SmpB [bacterium]|nr:SsrA-binding protein SmpB [bacterium]